MSALGTSRVPSADHPDAPTTRRLTQRDGPKTARRGGHPRTCRLFPSVSDLLGEGRRMPIAIREAIP